jgi:hypothetical protein
VTERLDRELAEKLLAGLQCSKGVRCADSGLEHLCRARQIGRAKVLECLETDEACKFSFRMGHSPLLCVCPVRMHLYKQLTRNR